MDTNILLVFLKFIAAYVFVFVILPCFIFNNIKEDIAKSIFTNYIKINFWIIAFGYITIVAKLYEIITFFAITALFIFYKYYKKHIQSGDYRFDISDKFRIIVINHADNVERIEDIILRYMRNRFDDVITRLYHYFKQSTNTVMFFIFTGVFIYFGYLLFYDSLSFVAPAADESFTSLIGMKNLGSNKLFYDSIYPQGFYIVLQTMQRLFKVDHIFIINFTNALYSLLILAVIYFFVSRISKNKFGGIIAVLIYGLMRNSFFVIPELLNIASPIQFAFLFLFPVLYYYYEHIQTSNLSDLYTAMIGSSLIGLIHPMAFLCLAIGIVALLIANFLRYIKTVGYNLVNVIIIMLLASLISIMPIFIGFLYNKSFSSAMLNIITETDEFLHIPAIKAFDILGMASITIIFVSLLFYIKDKTKFIERAWIFLFSIISLLLYLYGAAMTQSKYLQLVTNILWSFIIPIAVAFAFVTITDVINKAIRYKYSNHIICVVIFIAVYCFIPLKPIISVKRDSENLVGQYIKINRMLRPTQWITVSWEEGYAYALESGFHMLTDEFIYQYDPSNDKLLNVKDDYKELKAKDIFIFYHKNIADKNLSDEDKEYKMNINDELLNWIDTYTQNHSNLTLYYEDAEIQIWRIHQELSRQEMQAIIWES